MAGGWVLSRNRASVYQMPLVGLFPQARSMVVSSRKIKADRGVQQSLPSFDTNREYSCPAVLPCPSGCPRGSTRGVAEPPW